MTANEIINSNDISFRLLFIVVLENFDYHITMLEVIITYLICQLHFMDLRDVFYDEFGKLQPILFVLSNI